MYVLPQPTSATLKYPRPRLAVSLGDPAGIGPEVILKALAAPEVVANCDVTVIGTKSKIIEIYSQLIQNPSHRSAYANPEELSILDVEVEEINNIIPGVGNAASGAASFAYLKDAIARTLAGEFDAIVTAPIAKSAWKAAGYNYPGQTELLAQQAGVDQFAMLFVARSPYTGWTLRTLLATTHIPLCQVAEALNPQLLSHKLELLLACLAQDFGLKTPKIAIAGLNPHSGELGQLGSEEQAWLIPWIEQQRLRYPEIQLDGPIPPDTMWVKPSQAWYGELISKQVDLNQVADAYLALYHDQGLIPVKQLAFDRAVNTSIGLPFIRTSPDHGTAFDIAGAGIADATSMKAALQLATELSSHRVVR